MAWTNGEHAKELRLAVERERKRCADIALAIDSGRGNEKEIARAILNPIDSPAPVHGSAGMSEPRKLGINRDPIYAPDGTTWYYLALEEAEKRGKLEAKIDRLRLEPVPVDQWPIVIDEDVLIYVVHPNAEYEADEKRRKDEWEAWCVGRWINHNGGGWTWHGLCGRVTHVAPLPARPAIPARC